MAPELRMHAHRFGETVVLDIGTWRVVMGVPQAEVIGRKLLMLATEAEADQADRELAALTAGRLVGKPPREPAMVSCACKCGPEAAAWQHARHCPKANA